MKAGARERIKRVARVAYATFHRASRCRIECGTIAVRVRTFTGGRANLIGRLQVLTLERRGVVEVRRGACAHSVTDETLARLHALQCARARRAKGKSGRT